MSKNDSGKLDARGIPTNECPNCAGTDCLRFRSSFDDDYNVGQYLLDAECAICGTLVTAPTPFRPSLNTDPQDVRWL